VLIQKEEVIFGSLMRQRFSPYLRIKSLYRKKKFFFGLFLSFWFYKYNNNKRNRFECTK